VEQARESSDEWRFDQPPFSARPESWLVVARGASA